MGTMDTDVKDALDDVRAAAQGLHAAISDVAGKRGGATKADLESFAQKAKTIAASARSSLDAQRDATKKHLAEAVTHLEETQKHAAEGMKSSGQAFQDSIKKTLADARASVQKVSEAVAAKRSALSKKTR